MWLVVALSEVLYCWWSRVCYMDHDAELECQSMCSVRRNEQNSSLVWRLSGQESNGKEIKGEGERQRQRGKRGIGNIGCWGCGWDERKTRETRENEILYCFDLSVCSCLSVEEHPFHAGMLLVNYKHTWKELPFTKMVLELCVQRDFCTLFKRWKLRSLDREESRLNFIDYLQLKAIVLHSMLFTPWNICFKQKMPLSLAQQPNWNP